MTKSPIRENSHWNVQLVMPPRSKFFKICIVAVCLATFAGYNLLNDHRIDEGDTVKYDSETPVFGEIEIVSESEQLHNFSTWLEEFRSGKPDEKFVDQGVELAKARMEIMSPLIKQDAESALINSIGYADYSILPQEIRQYVEEPFSIRGDLEIIAVCGEKNSNSEFRTAIYDGDGDRFRVGAHQKWRTGVSKAKTSLQGIRMDGWVAIEPTVLNRVSGRDLIWAQRNLPNGNVDTEADFLTGEPIGDGRVVAAEPMGSCLDF